MHTGRVTLCFLPLSTFCPPLKRTVTDRHKVNCLFSFSVRLLLNMLFSSCLLILDGIAFQKCMFLFLFVCHTREARSASCEGGPLKTETWDIELAVLYLNVAAYYLMCKWSPQWEAFLCRLYTQVCLLVHYFLITPGKDTQSWTLSSTFCHPEKLIIRFFNLLFQQHPASIFMESLTATERLEELDTLLKGTPAAFVKGISCSLFPDIFQTFSLSRIIKLSGHHVTPRTAPFHFRTCSSFEGCSGFYSSKIFS